MALQAFWQFFFLFWQRRAGILAGGKGDHVDLAKSWTELGLLAQCTNRLVQEGQRWDVCSEGPLDKNLRSYVIFIKITESLELLITSLGHAPPSIDQLPRYAITWIFGSSSCTILLVSYDVNLCKGLQLHVLRPPRSMRHGCVASCRSI